MPSSTSSSDERRQPLAWPRVWLLALLISVAFAGVMELSLALRGFRPSLADSESLWLSQRQRADALGSDAILLIGGSRIQVSTDLDVLRKLSGRPPVQLAIDGSGFLPVWHGLVNDPRINGLILVDYYDHVIAHPEQQDRASQYERDFEKIGRTGYDRSAIEDDLAEILHMHLRSYADGASPFNSLRTRLLASQATPQYLTTRPDRQRELDTRRVPPAMRPRFYYARALMELGEDADAARSADFGTLERTIRQEVSQLPAADNAAFLRQVAAMRDDVQRLRSRGAQVIFIRLPVSGLVREIDERRYPRARFWDRFAEAVGAPAINFADYPSLRTFECPDGSHLDRSDRVRFTRALVGVLQAKGLAGADQ